MDDRNRVLEIKMTRTQPELRRLLALYAGVLAISIVLFILYMANPRLISGQDTYFLLVPFFGFVMVLIDGVITIREYVLARRLDAEGVLKSVKIDCKLSTRSYPNYDKGVSRVGNFLEYRLPEGSRVRLAVGKKVFQSAVENQSVTVRYLVDYPSVQRVEERRSNG